MPARSRPPPLGLVQIAGIIARFPGKPGAHALAVTGHFHTRRFNFPFVGASGAASSTGSLLEMARALKGQTMKHDVYLVWFDGEEAFREWSETDSLYGSRHLAEKWYRDGTLARMKALINVDMIGGKDLVIEDEQFSSAALRAIIWQAARELNYGPGNSWWHTPADTMDKLSASSLEAVGRTVLETLRRLDR